MKTFNPFFISLIFLLAGIATCAAQISTIESREALLAKAERLNVASADSAVKDRFAAIPDPFNRPEDQRNEVAASASPAGETQPQARVSDQAALQAISEKIRPTGVMRFGNEILLVFGERRVRVGDFISVQHLGLAYKVKIEKADTSGFMLRLNDETISKRIQ